MALTAEDAFVRGLDLFESVAAQVDDAGWQAPSPCEGWRAIDVLGHLGEALRMGTSLLRGEQPEWAPRERPGDAVEGDPLTWLRALTADARSSLDGANLDAVMETPMGPRTVRDRLAFPALDLFVHAWDIGQAVGIDIEIPTDVIEFAHSYIDPIPPEMVRGPGGAFGPEADPPEGATPTQAFIAWTGRTPIEPVA